MWVSNYLGPNWLCFGVASPLLVGRRSATIRRSLHAQTCYHPMSEEETPPQPVSLHSGRWSAWWVGTSILLSVTEGFAMDSLQRWGRHLKCLLFSKNLFLHGIHPQCLQEDTGQFPYKGTPSFLTIQPLCHSQRAHPHVRIKSTKRLMLFARGPSYVKVGESLKLYVSRCERAKPVPCPASWTGSKG